MATIAQDFSLYAGDTATIIVTLTDASGGALDPTGLTFVWGLGPPNGGPATVIKTSANPAEIEIVDDVKVAVYLAPVDTVALSGGRRHEMRVIDPSGAVETVMVGSMTIYRSALQPTARTALRVVA